MSKTLLTIAALSAFTSLAAAQNYTLVDLTPPGYLEGFFQGAGGTFGVGNGSFLLPDPPFPDARGNRAFVWDQSTGTMTDLDANGVYSATFAFGAGGNQQVGYGFTSGPNIALLWTGSTSSTVQLNTQGTLQTVAYATDGSTQVGSAITDKSLGESRGWMWNGTAESGRQLAHPDTFNASLAAKVRNGRIVGTGDDINYFQAGLYWANADADVVVIRPDGFEETRLIDIDGDWAAGSGYGQATNFQRHAFMWNVNDPTESISFHPTDPNYTFSEINALLESSDVFADGIQVGTAGYLNQDFELIEQAAVWFGSAESFINLHSFVEAQFGSSFRFSKANGIDEYGNIYGTAFDGMGNFRSVQWTVPAPGSMVAFGAFGLLARRRRR